jgi:DNA modification methylase
MSAEILHGDCIEQMTLLIERGVMVDSIVTDPPAGIAFMGKEWDHHKGGRDQWIAWMEGVADKALVLAKPGAHALVWALPKTSHWTVTAWENAGWEVRDRVSHLFGTGFPKSLDISKAIDKMNGREFEDRYELGRHIRVCREAMGISRKKVNERFESISVCQHWEAQDYNNALPPTPKHWEVLKNWLGCDPKYDGLVDRLGAEREILKERTMMQGGGNALQIRMGEARKVKADITAASTEAAQKWEGWGTALKPAMEDWWLLRKPLSEPTVAANVLKHGVGGVNIDECRIGTETRTYSVGGTPGANVQRLHGGDGRDAENARNYAERMRDRPNVTVQGRFPSHLIHDGSEEVMGGFAQFGSWQTVEDEEGNVVGRKWVTPERFFYAAKANKSDRFGSKHPTVKSIALLRYLCKLITPTGGVVLDPFAGSGTTLAAAHMEGFHSIGIEKEDEYIEDIKRRVAFYEKDPVSELLL